MQYRFIFFLALFPIFLSAQSRRALDKPENRGDAILLHFAYGRHQTAGDLADRFGESNSLMFATEYLLTKNYFFGLQGQLFFGKDVKEDPVSILRNTDGNIIGNNRGLAMFVLRERGLHFGAYAGKLFAFGEKRSGIRLSVGAGMMRHKIRIQDDGSSIDQLKGDYLKGYDRLTGGLALTQFLGYQRIPLRNGLTWFAGLEFEEGFTKSWRDWDFSSKMKLEGSRTDLRVGLRVGFSLPFHFVKKTEDIFY